ncbi:MAG: OsmC family protein [Thermomicrobiales bacterium]
MKISASLRSGGETFETSVTTNGVTSSLGIPAKPDGHGSRINGGELLFLALANCYCYDIYREAAKRGIDVQHVEVDVIGEFEGIGEPARSVTYNASVTANAAESEIQDLMIRTDSVAEIQNTLRAAIPVTLGIAVATSNSGT